MLIYWLIFIALFLGSALGAILKSSKGEELSYFLLAFVLLVGIATFRWDVGNDDLNYLELFESVRITSQVENASAVYIEPGYLLINKITLLLGGNITLVFFLSAALAVGLNLRAYYKLSPFFALSVFLYFVHTFLYREMNQVRAGIACAICINLIPFVSEKKYVKLGLGLLLGAMFHSVALLFFLGCCLSWLNLKSKTMIILLVCVIAAGLFYPMGRILSLFLGVDSTSSDILNKAALYVDGEGISQVGVFTNPTTIKQLFFFSLFLFFRSKLAEKLRYFETMLSFYFLSLCWLILFNDIAIIAGRVATVFSTVEVIVVPALLLGFTFRSRVVVWVALLLVNTAIFSLNLYMIKPVSSYKTVFKKQ